MNPIDPTPDADLSDGDAVARLFDLATQGDVGSAELQRLDAIVYGRLLRTYAAGDAEHRP